MSRATRKPPIPTIAASISVCISSQVSSPAPAPVNAEPSVRPKMPRSTTEPISTANSSSGQWLTADELHHLLERRVDAAVEVPLAEVRRQGLIDDAVAQCIGQDPLEAVADFDARAPIVLGDEQDGPVIDLLAAELPLFGHADRVLGNVLGLCGRYHQHREL